MAELDGSIAKTRYAAKRLVPYLPRTFVTPGSLVDMLSQPDAELEDITVDGAPDDPDDAACPIGSPDGDDNVDSDEDG